ncbi:hypothetical protein AAG570_001061 [Ranatra chinensis]|uniref:Inosine/uridine-preferring nucleoside hydrolase domain-containing protein n=1 Tax=Ranatra chinensis TaxID=642074 RepID=A0ABD0YX77_9HEMI
MAMLLFLSKRSRADVVAITCVTGNTDVEKGSINTLKTLSIASRSDIPVYVGSGHGIVYSTKISDYFGSDGFGDFFYPNPPNDTLLKTEHAAMALADIVRNNPGEITLLSLGPLTNVALAMHIYPNLLKELKQYIILGGSIKGGGNVKPGVEFNMFTDPEAAVYVFSHAPPSVITLFPIEVIQDIPFPMTWRKNVLGSLLSKAMRLLNKAESLALSKQKEWLVYDPTAAASLLDRNIIENSTTADVFIETGGLLSRGAMFHLQNDSGRVKIVTKVNKPVLMSLLMNYLA